MKPKKKDIISARGDSIYITIRAKDPSLPVSAVKLSCKKSEKDTAYIFQKTLADGIAAMGDGRYRIRIAPEDTEDLPPAMYWYDIQVTTGGDVYTPYMGNLKLLIDITGKEVDGNG